MKLTNLIVATLALPMMALASPQKACETLEQAETLTKIESCLPSTDGAEPLSTNSFNGASASMHMMSFYQCLYQTHEISKTAPDSDVRWSDVYQLTLNYFKYNLKNTQVYQEKRCDLATTLNRLMLIGKQK